MADIARNIVWYRSRLRVSQAELAKRVGVRQATVSDWESGKAEPTEANIAGLETVFGIAPGALRKPHPRSVEVREPITDLPRQLRLMALDFEREALHDGADDAFMRYVRSSFADPDFVALFAGGPDESPMTSEEAIDEMREHVRELRAILKRRLARSQEQSGKLAPGLDE